MIGFREYLSYAEKHLELAEREIESGRRGDEFLIPSVILAWSAIECFVNNRLDEFDSLPEGLFDLHEKAFLTEQLLTFENKGARAGQFIIKGSSYRRLSDKILFLIAKCGSTVNKGEALWQNFDEKLKGARDSLIHPRQAKYAAIDAALTRECINIAKDLILFISEGLGHKVEF